MRRWWTLAVCFVAVVSLAPTCQKPASRQTRLGLAGIVPPGATMKDGQIDTTPDSWSAFWGFARSHADHLAVHSPWRSVLPVLEQAKLNGMSMTVVTSIKDATDEDLPAYLELVQKVAAAAYDIRWWCVGNEVDADPDLQSEAVRARSVMRAIQAAKPSTRTCVVFQFERSLGSPDTAAKIALFPEAEAVFFTTYPGTAGSCRTASCLPSDYYAKISTWTPKPIGFSEVGWSSDVGGDGEQRAFLDRFLQSLAPRTAVIANWFTPYDIAGIQPQPPSFGHMGLCMTTTSCRSALTSWDTARSIPLAQ